MKFLYNTTQIRLIRRIAGGALVLLPIFVRAQDIDPPPAPITDLLAFFEILCGIAGFIFGVAILVSVVMVLYASYLYMTSSGDANKISQAHKTWIYAGVGIAVALIAGGLPSIVAEIMGAFALK